MSDPRVAFEEAQEQFILEWGRMSSSWGINRTVAQIHALLFTSERPLSVDEIMDRLQISRGNASMNLRDLMEWGIVRRFRKPGERRDTYVSDHDPLTMFARVVRERKRREIDPTVTAIRDCIERLPGDDPDPQVVAFRNRLTGLLEIFAIIDKVYEQVFATDRTIAEAMEVFRSGSALGEK